MKNTIKIILNFKFQIFIIIFIITFIIICNLTQFRVIETAKQTIYF